MFSEKELVQVLPLWTHAVEDVWPLLERRWHGNLNGGVLRSRRNTLFVRKVGDDTPGDKMVWIVIGDILEILFTFGEKFACSFFYLQGLNLPTFKNKCHTWSLRFICLWFVKIVNNLIQIQCQFAFTEIKLTSCEVLGTSHITEKTNHLRYFSYYTKTPPSFRCVRRHGQPHNQYQTQTTRKKWTSRINPHTHTVKLEFPD